MDWKYVCVIAICKACQPPGLLEGRSRDSEPRRESYRAYDPNVDEDDAEEYEGIIR